MARSKNQYQKLTFEDLIYDAVVACSNSPFAVATGQLFRSRWTRVSREKVNGRLNSPTSVGI